MKEIFARKMPVTGTIVWVLFIICMAITAPIFGNEISQIVVFMANQEYTLVTTIIACIPWCIIMVVPGIIIIRRFYKYPLTVDFFMAGFISCVILSILFMTEFMQPIRLPVPVPIAENLSPQISALAEIVYSQEIEKEKFDSIQLHPSQYGRAAKLLGCSELEIETRLDPKNWESEEILQFRGD